MAPFPIPFCRYASLLPINAPYLPPPENTRPLTFKTCALPSILVTSKLLQLHSSSSLLSSPSPPLSCQTLLGPLLKAHRPKFQLCVLYRYEVNRADLFFFPTPKPLCSLAFYCRSFLFRSVYYGNLNLPAPPCPPLPVHRGLVSRSPPSPLFPPPPFFWFFLSSILLPGAVSPLDHVHRTFGSC